MKLSRWALVAAPLALAACDGGFGSAMTSHTDVVAKAAGKELKVEDAAQLLAANPQIPEDKQVVGALAELWVDYTLLATAAAEDSTLAVLDLDKFAEDQREDQTVFRYLESTVRTDTSLSDQQLEQLWNTEGPGVEVKARHILLMPRAQGDTVTPTPAQTQAIRQRAEQIRARAAAGEDFAQLAAQTTEEPGGKERGGDLGWFGRGRMVAQFEEAALKMQPGQVSPVVETPFGYHVIKVEDRRQTPMAENRAAFRQQAVQQQRQKAVGAYVDSLKKSSNLQVQPEAIGIVKEIAGGEDLALRGRSAARKLVTFQGGELNAGELAELMQSAQPQEREQIKTAQDEQLRGLLEDQALREVLLAEAGRKNFTLAPAVVDSINRNTRSAVRELLQVSGLGGRQFPADKKARNGAIQEAVRNLMQEAVAGQRPIRPLGKLGYALRKYYEGASVNDESFERVVTRMKAIRASQPQPQPGQGGMPGGPQGQPMPMPQQGGQPVPQGQQVPQPQQSQPQPAQPAPAPQGETQAP